MRISDWSSDVCSSDLAERIALSWTPVPLIVAKRCRRVNDAHTAGPAPRHGPDRKSVVSGKSVSVRVDLGGRRIIKKKKRNTSTKKTKSTKYIHKHKQLQQSEYQQTSSAQITTK